VAPLSQTLDYVIKLSIIFIAALFSLIQFFAKESDYMALLAQHATYTYPRCVTGYLKYF